MIGAHDATAVAAFPQLQALIELRNAGWTLRPVLDDNHEVTVVQGFRVYPHGWVDAIGVRYTTDAQALRCDPDGGVVWKRTGGLVEVFDALRELPCPRMGNAPQLVIGTGPALWTPGGRS